MPFPLTAPTSSSELISGIGGSCPLSGSSTLGIVVGFVVCPSSVAEQTTAGLVRARFVLAYKQNAVYDAALAFSYAHATCLLYVHNYSS